MTRSSKLLFTIFALLIPALSHSTSLKYESTEHIIAGDKVKIRFSPTDPGQSNFIFSLPNGIQLSYGQVLSMGDFYEIVGQRIGDDSLTTDKRRARFLAALHSLTEDTHAVTEVPRIMQVIAQEQAAVTAGEKNGEKISDVYARIDGDDNRLWNCATGGGCLPDIWWMQPGKYLRLVAQDHDHFAQHAEISYQTGHQIALETAIAAHQTHDLQKLQQAYLINAFASHFLSDQFASGHMRTPRAELATTVTPSALGSLLSNFMHTEENTTGLHVHNLRGDRWYAFGDRFYFDAANSTNRAIAEEALQLSADEIFFAYQNGVMPNDSVAKLLPIPDESNQIAALFYWDATTKILYRRADITNPNDHHWTADWWGWTTLIELARYHGLPVGAQAQLIHAGYGTLALRHGLLSDKSIRDFALTKLEK